MAWDVFWWLTSKKERNVEDNDLEIKEEIRSKLTAKDIWLKKKIERLYDIQNQIDHDYMNAKVYIDRNIDRVKNPILRKVIQQLFKEFKTRSLYRHRHVHKIPIIVVADAIVKGLYRDESKFIAYIIGRSISISMELIKEVSEGVKLEDLKELYSGSYPSKLEEDVSYINPSLILEYILNAINKAVKEIGVSYTDTEDPVIKLGLKYRYRTYAKGIEWFSESESLEEEIEDYLKKLETHKDEGLRRIGTLIREYISNPFLGPQEKDVVNQPLTTSNESQYSNDHVILLEQIAVTEHLNELEKVIHTWENDLGERLLDPIRGVNTKLIASICKQIDPNLTDLEVNAIVNGATIPNPWEPPMPPDVVIYMALYRALTIPVSSKPLGLEEIHIALIGLDREMKRKLTTLEGMLHLSNRLKELGLVTTDEYYYIRSRIKKWKYKSVQNIVKIIAEMKRKSETNINLEKILEQLLIELEGIMKSTRSKKVRNNLEKIIQKYKNYLKLSEN